MKQTSTLTTANHDVLSQAEKGAASQRTILTKYMSSNYAHLLLPACGKMLKRLWLRKWESRYALLLGSYSRLPGFG